MMWGKILLYLFYDFIIPYDVILILWTSLPHTCIALVLKVAILNLYCNVDGHSVARQRPVNNLQSR
jgi:hypothetical protein